MSNTYKKCEVCETGIYKAFPRNICEKHNVCVYCGIKRKDLDHTPWGVCDGAFKCIPCEKSEREAGIAARVAAGFEHEYTQEVVCPYCGCEHIDSWEFGESGEVECADCMKTFKFERIVTCDYSTERLDL